MSLSRAVMLQRAKARDPAFDGRFLTGVLSTGIYCLPSCPARTPHDHNVRHFSDPAAARAAGLRACRRCRPDDFYRGHDPELVRVRGIALQVRETPGEFASGAAMASRAGVGFTKLTELFRAHYHTTPAAYLLRARVAAAGRRLLTSGRRVLEVGLEVGFESSSAFHDNFRKQQGMAPGDYRRLGRGSGFEVALPSGFRIDGVLQYLGRDPESVSERVWGSTVAKAMVVEGHPLVLTMELLPERARCTVVGGVDATAVIPPAAVAACHRAVVRMLNLRGDPSGFERLVTRKLRHPDLIRRRRGIRVALAADPFECLCWAILGQQVNLAFAYALRRRLIRTCSAASDTLPVAGLLPHPTSEQVARLAVADLLPQQFSRRKAEYLIDTARLIAGADLSLDELEHQSIQASRARLLEVRGLGPWSVDYLMMKGFGHADCVPIGDAGLTAALQRFFDLEQRPDAAQTAALLRPFAPWRSLATYHFWHSLGDDDR